MPLLFFFFSPFFFSRQIFSVAPLPPCTCAMLSPKAWLPWAAGKHLALHSHCPISAHRSCPPSGQKWVMGFEHNISSWHHAGMASVTWAALSRKPCGDCSLLVQPLWAATVDCLTSFTVRPRFINIIFLFQSVFQVFLECRKWRAGLCTKCPVLNPIYMQKLCQLTLRLNQCKPLLWGLF